MKLRLRSVVSGAGSRAVRLALFIAAVVLALSSSPAGAATGEVAVGLSNAVIAGPPADEALHLGVAPLVIALGWWVSPRVAIGLRACTYVLPSTVAGRREPFLSSFAGPAVSVWARRDLVLGAAAGPGVVWPSPVGASPYLRTNRGLGMSLRASWAVRPAAGGEVLVGAELLPVAFDDGAVLVGSLLTVGLGWR